MNICPKAKNLHKKVQNFDKYQMNPPKIAKQFLKVAKNIIPGIAKSF